MVCGLSIAPPVFHLSNGAGNLQNGLEDLEAGMRVGNDWPRNYLDHIDVVKTAQAYTVITGKRHL